MAVNPPTNPYKAYTVQTQILHRAFEAVVKQNEKTIAASQKGMAGDYAKMLRQLREIVGNAHESYARYGKLSWQELQRYDRIRKLETQVDEAIRDGYKPIKKRAIGDSKTVIENTFTQTAEAFNVAANLDMKTFLTGEQINAILSKPWSGVTLQEKMLLRQVYLGNQIKGEIRRSTLNDGVTYKENIDSIKKLVTKDYAGMKRNVEDAAHSYQGDTQQNVLDNLAEEDIVIKKVWLTREDERVREAHEALNGQAVDANEQFTVPSGEYAGYVADAPGTFGIDALDRNCRCVMIVTVQPKEKE